MRVVDRKAFLTLPEGTIYAKGKRWFFDALCIKGETVGNDWCYTNPAWVDAHDSGEAFGRLEEMLAKGTSYPCEKDEARDGLFDDEDLFLVFEHEDLLWLRDRIDSAIAASMY